MSRGLSTANETEVNKNGAGLVVLFAELDFSGGMVRAHNQLGTITWGGNDWLGVGTFAKVSVIEESAELSKRTITFTLNGIPTELRSLVLNEDYQGRSAKLYVGFIDQTTGQLVSDPDLLDQGRMDVSDTEIGKDISITITAESRVSAWDRPLVRRYTNADQQSRFPGDRGLEYIDQAANKAINWGRKE